MRPALVAALLLIGCKKTPAEDSDPPTPVPTPAQGEAGVLECTGEVAYWRVAAPAGPLTLAVDTVDAGTAFDIGLEMWRVDDFFSDPEDYVLEDVLGFGDDEFDCTFPPPQFGCPEVTIEADGADFLAIVYAATPCGGDEGHYDLTVAAGNATLTFLYTGPDPAAN